MLIVFSFVFFFQTAQADTTIKLGEYGLATEAGWGAGFELKEDGTAIVTPQFDSEGDDETEETTGVRPKLRKILAKWKKSNGGIEIDYLEYQDQFQFEAKCKKWPDHPCFNYVKSLANPKIGSLLKFKQSFVNWGELSVKKWDTKKCKIECEKMERAGTIKKGLTVNKCIESLCK